MGIEAEQGNFKTPSDGGTNVEATVSFLVVARKGEQHKVFP